MRQPNVGLQRIRVVGAVLLCVGLLATTVACGAPVSTPRPSPSLLILQFTPRPSLSSAPPATASPTPVDWPVGWDVGFCAMFDEAIIAQQLVVDVERAMAEGNTHDAQLLADELTLTADHATELLAALPIWPQAESAVVGIAALMDLGSRAGTEYHSWFSDGKRAALRNARALRAENGTKVPVVNEDLQALADAGLSCPGTSLSLEAP